MCGQTIKENIRLKPSSRAREIGYSKLRALFHILDMLMVSHPWFRGDEDYEYDHNGWKEWINKYTPPTKRGGPSEPSKRRRQKKADRNSTIRSGLRR